MDLARADEGHGFGELHAEDLDLLVGFGLGDTFADAAGEEDLHALAEEAGTGVVLREELPLLCAVAGLFDHLALRGGKRGFVGLDAACGKLEEKLAYGVAVLTLDNDDGVFGICRFVNCEDDDGADVPDDVAFEDEAVGLLDCIRVDVENTAFVDELRGDQHRGLHLLLRSGHRRLCGGGLYGGFCYGGLRWRGFFDRANHMATVSSSSGRICIGLGAECIKLRITRPIFFTDPGRVLTMSTECYPITVLPHVTQLYRDYISMANGSSVAGWYGAKPFGTQWMGPVISVGHRERLADALREQSVELGAGAAAFENIEKLRGGARAVVTGQQVGLFGGPLLTLLKAATAIARAGEATVATGVEHVPVFWLATEDHDLEEVDQISLLTKTSIEKITAGLKTAVPVEVGAVQLGAGIEAVLEQVSEVLGYAPMCDDLREFYAADATLGGAFARLMTRVFAAHGLIVMDAASREFHALGASALWAAVERAGELEEALLARSRELERDGYHAQVLVKANASLLFLIDEATGERLALRHLPEGSWKAGSKGYSTEELLGILESAPERVSPNALLRPVFQDTILPTAAYVGGPAEIAYFAQSAVLYERILGRITPVLPRLSATLIEPPIGEVMAKHEVSLPDAMTTAEALAQRLGARAMPIETKRRLAAVGNAMDAELAVLTEYLAGMDESLGRAAGVSGSKMRYQMNRLRRMAATVELQKEASLRKHADALTLNLFPDGHPQERLVGGVWFLARYGDVLVDRLVEEAKNLCPGHVVVRL